MKLLNLDPDEKEGNSLYFRLWHASHASSKNMREEEADDVTPQGPKSTDLKLAAEIDQVELQPLRLPSKFDPNRGKNSQQTVNEPTFNKTLATKSWAQSPATWALAAGLIAAIFVSLPKTSLKNAADDLTPKGQVKVDIFWERQGRSQLLKPNNSLRNGDRVLAKVMTPWKAEAFWGVQDASHRWLVSREQFLASRITVEKGAERTFTRSFSLTGQNIGEVVVVAVCPADKARALVSSDRVFDQLQAKDAKVAPCLAYRQPLR